MEIRLLVVDETAGARPVASRVVGSSRGHEAARGAPRAVLVQASPGDRASDLARALSSGRVGADEAPPRLVCGAAVVPADRPVGLPPLLDGAVVRLVDPAPEDSEDFGPQHFGPHRSAGMIAGVPLSGLLELHCLAGPDAGRRWQLPAGRHELGRAASARIQLSDNGASRWHAVIEVTADGVWVSDPGSTNGVLLEGARVTGEPTRLVPEVVMRIGGNRFAVRAPAGAPMATDPDRAGHLLTNVAPCFVPPVRVGEVALPTSDSLQAAPRRFPWVVTLLPLLAGGLLALVMHSPVMLVYGLLTPVMGAASWWSESRSGRTGRAAEQATTAQQREAALAQHAEHVRVEAADRRRVDPDPALLCHVATHLLEQTWHRRRSRDGLRVTLGLADQPARSTIHSADDDHDPPGTDGTALAGVLERTDGQAAGPARLLVQDVPVVVDLDDAEVLGVTGEREQRLSCARSLVAQLLALHAPDDLEVLVVSRAPQDWAWCAWAPQACLVDPRTANPARVAGGADGSDPPCQLIVLDRTDDPASAHDLSRWLSTRAGTCVVVLAADPPQLPEQCSVVLELTHGSARLARRDGSEVTGICPTGLSLGDASSVAHAIAPLRLSVGSSRQLPVDVRLTDLVAREPDPTGAGRVAPTPGSLSHTPGSLVRTWHTAPASTRVVLGVDADGPCVVDLDRDGPHALVAGTTGSGKSELLQTLVTGLALGNAPDRLSFVLVDYKGGAAFAGLAGLPHVSGIVTDLDEHLGARALVSLRAELRRREHILKAAGVADLPAYQALPQAGLDPLARLVIVVDEFRVLAEELPAFVTGLVRIATVGRSLGVHLVLATQRPAGVVTPDIRANVGLRIALRVRDDLDSVDVVGTSAAARLPGDRPGRACLVSPRRELTTFQTARVTLASRPDGRPPLTVRDLDVTGAPGPVSRHEDADLPTDLERIVASVRSACLAGGWQPARPAWLPALPTRLDPALSQANPRSRPTAAGGPAEVGLVDDPESLDQRPLTLELDAPVSVSFAGGPGSGRSTALRTVASAMLTALGADGVQVHVLHAGALGDLGDLPGAGVVTSDPAMGVRLVERLVTEAELRRQSGAAAVPELPGASAGLATSGGPRRERILLVVDDWEAVSSWLAPVGHGRLLEALTGLVRDAPALGVDVALAGGRTLVTGRLAMSVRQRFLLRPSDATDLVLAGLAPADALRFSCPGRAVRLADGLDCQLALPPEPRQLAALLGDDGAVAGRGIRIVPLPQRCHWGDLAAAPRGALHHGALHRAAPRRDTPPHGGLAHGALLIGVGGDEATPQALPTDLSGGRALVVGPPGSGRSSAMATVLAAALEQHRPCVVLADRAGPLTALAQSRGIPVLAVEDDAELVRLRTGTTELVVMVDDLDALAGRQVAAVVEEIARLTPSSGGLVVGATSGVGVGRRLPVVSALAAHRVGLLLRGCGPDEAELVGVRLAGGSSGPELTGGTVGGGASSGPPGRALLVVRGEVTPVQVALPPQR